MSLFVEEDNGRGTVRACWSRVREQVYASNPEFAGLMDACGQDDSDDFFLVYIPYGGLKDIDNLMCFPNAVGRGYSTLSPKSNPECPLYKAMRYAFGSSPFGMVLDKGCEFFADLGTHIASNRLYRKGEFFSWFTGLKFYEGPPTRFYSNKLFNTMSGARSLYMVPPIGDQGRLNQFATDASINMFAPKYAMEQAELFAVLANTLPDALSWKTCLLYFSGDLIQKIRTEPQYAPVLRYLIGKEQEDFLYEKSMSGINAMFTVVQKKLKLRPNALIFDIIRHIFSVAAGQTPGFIPMTDNTWAPISSIADFFVDCYWLEDIPTMMGPAYYDYLRDEWPIYISIKVSSMLMQSLKKQTSGAMIDFLRELDRYLREILKEMRDPTGIFAGTLFQELAMCLDFELLHDYLDRQGVVLNVPDLEKKDPRMLVSLAKNQPPNTPFYSFGEFFRGCIRIRRKNHSQSLDAS